MHSGDKGDLQAELYPLGPYEVVCKASRAVLLSW